MKKGVLVFFVLLNSILWGQLHSYKNFNHLDGLNISGILSLKQDDAGFLWLGTAGSGLIRYDGEFFKEFPLPKGIPPLHVSDFVIDKNNNFYLTTLYSGLIHFDGEKYKVLNKNKDFQEIVNHIEIFKDKLLLFGNNQIIATDKKGKKIWVKKIAKSIQSSKNAYQYLLTPSGVLMFSENETLLVTDKKIITLKGFFKSIPSNFNTSFAEFNANSLTIYDCKNGAKITVNYTRYGNFTVGKVQKSKLLFPENETPNLISAESSPTIMLFGEYSFKTIKDGKLRNITFNSEFKIGSNVLSIFKDNQGIIWMGSGYGLGRISIEPFTKIGFDPIYSSSLIGFVDLIYGNLVVIGTYTKETFTGTIGKSNSFIRHEFSVNSKVTTPQGLFFGTNLGLKKILPDGSVLSIPQPFSVEDKLLALYYDGNFIYCSNQGEGFYTYQPCTNNWRKLIPKKGEFPKYVYTAQGDFTGKKIYFGTSSGIYIYSPITKELKNLNVFKNEGSYVGTSTLDKFGTIWFTNDNGLCGLTKINEYVKITSDAVFKSKLFYTLTSDPYGNLIVGTNKGISFIKVNVQGTVLSVKNYDIKSGFGGYETNMRASFQSGNMGYVGTIEGLFQINSELLEKTQIPINTIILRGRESKNGDLIVDKTGVFFTFKTLLSENKNVKYSYRIIGVSDKWSDFSETSEIELKDNLASGEYTLEMQASYDGINSSKITREKIIIEQPIWKSKWFIFLLILFIGIGNIIYFETSKKNLNSRLIDTSEITIESLIAVRLVFSGVFTNILLTVTLFYLENSFNIHVINIGFTLLLAFFASATLSDFKKQNNNQLINKYLTISSYISIIQFFLLAYFTGMRPYCLIAIVIINSTIPYTFSKFKTVLFFGVFQLLLCGLLLVTSDQTTNNIGFFAIGIILSIGVSIILSSIRIRALEKLIFINNVLNNGNLFTIAFDNFGTIVYCSNNISTIFNVNARALTGKSISALNAFVVTQEMREMKLKDEFKDGKIIIAPFYHKNNSICYIEWSCKKSGTAINVILGSDVTEKLRISTNYQSIVEYADDIIYNTDINGNILFVNEKGARSFGYKIENLLGKNFLHLIHPDYRDKVLKSYNDQFVNKIHNTYLEFPLRSKDGKIIWVGQNVTMTFEPGSRKRVSGFVALARDITEKRMNELVIEQQTKDIKLNIDSARSIQENLLPTSNYFSSVFKESFIFHKPKEIVSGDSYFVYRDTQSKYLILVDCSVYGVSGAFFSILVINIIKLIIEERKVTEPNEILTQLMSEFAKVTPNFNSINTKRILKCTVIRKTNNHISLSSSGLITAHVSAESVKLYRNTATHATKATFKTVEFELKENDVIYLSTDGYQNQVGGVKLKKFGFKLMQELMIRIQNESLPLQRKHFENALRNWKDTNEQTDDITLIGMRYKKAVELKAD